MVTVIFQPKRVFHMAFKLYKDKTSIPTLFPWEYDLIDGYIIPLAL